MNFGSSKVVEREPIKEIKNFEDEIGIEMYISFPSLHLPLDLLRQLAKIRIELLKSISLCTTMIGGVVEQTIEDKMTKYVQSYYQELSQIVKLNNSIKNIQVWSDNKSPGWNNLIADQVSHFLLRLAFAKDDELRRWFITMESYLFRYRYSREAPSLVKQYIENSKLNLQKLSQHEVNEVSDFLLTSSKNVTVMDTFYKVDFTQVLNLVRYRMVYIHKGIAYVPHTEVGEIVVTEFQRILSTSMNRIEFFYGRIVEDERMKLLLDAIVNSYQSNEYIPASYLASIDNPNSSTNIVTLFNIDKISVESFPPCMQNLHHNLKKHHHLRHFGRLQYGLFLKGAGMSMDDQVLFWKQEFMNVMNNDKFDKNYLYGIRYNYGQEGRRSNFSPYTCLRITKTNEPGLGDFHGCPFKHFDQDTLMKQLQMLNISNNDIEDMAELVSSKHYHVACSRFFEAVHKLPNNTVTITSPNEYFDLSRKYLHQPSNDPPQSLPPDN